MRPPRRDAPREQPSTALEQEPVGFGELAFRGDEARENERPPTAQGEPLGEVNQRIRAWLARRQ
jgi:hypothetical protein